MIRTNDKIERLCLAVAAGQDWLERHGDLDSYYVRRVVVSHLEAALSDLVLELDDQHRLHHTGGNLVVHYTSINTIESMLRAAAEEKTAAEDKTAEDKTAGDKTASLRLYDSAHFNDPEEGTYFVQALRLPKRHEWLLKKDVTHAYIASFIIPDRKNDLSDELRYWKAYGDQGRGCSLKLNIPRDHLRTVLYGARLKAHFRRTLVAILDILKPLVSTPSFRDLLAATVWRILGSVRYLYKDKPYRYEKECRFVVPQLSVERDQIIFEPEQQNDSLTRVRHYVLDSALDAKNILSTDSRITLGPAVQNPHNVAFYLDALKRKAGWNDGDPEIMVSSIRYRAP